MSLFIEQANLCLPTTKTTEMTEISIVFIILVIFRYFWKKVSALWGLYRYFGTSLLCMFLFIFEQIVNNFLVCLWMKWSLLFDHIIIIVIINIRRMISNKDYAYVTILLML